MALCVVHPWAPFLAGLLTGCWIGGIVACVGLLLLVGRRIRQLESLNRLLRLKLRARNRQRSTGTSGPRPTLMMPIPKSSRACEPPLGRVVRMN